MFRPTIPHPVAAHLKKLSMREIAWYTVAKPVMSVRQAGFVTYDTRDLEVRRRPAGSFVLGEYIDGKGHRLPNSPEAMSVIWTSLPIGSAPPPG